MKKSRYVPVHNLVKKEESLWPDKREVMKLAGDALVILLFLAGISAAVLTLAGY